MPIDDIPLMNMIKSKLGYQNERQKLIAENVANADTPGFAPRDLKAFTFAQHVSAGLAPVSQSRTDAGHIGMTKAAPEVWKAEDSPDSEARLDGNQVVLEDEMMKMNASKLDYDAAVGLYEQSLSMIRLAAKRPGQ